MKNNYILTKEIPTETKTASGLYIPTPKYNRYAEVVAIGENDSVKTGDRIIKTIGKGTEYTFENEKYEILHINHILAVIEDATEA
tara:strand:+ start:211 stop:465 length:255 start_codon:yes stop_codon:yes gene_type:complete